jgi:hypothetical protein
MKHRGLTEDFAYLRRMDSYSVMDVLDRVLNIAEEYITQLERKQDRLFAIEDKLNEIEKIPGSESFIKRFEEFKCES